MPGALVDPTLAIPMWAMPLGLKWERSQQPTAATPGAIMKFTTTSVPCWYLCGSLRGGPHLRLCPAGRKCRTFDQGDSGSSHTRVNPMSPQPDPTISSVHSLVPGSPGHPSPSVLSVLLGMPQMPMKSDGPRHVMADGASPDAMSPILTIRFDPVPLKEIDARSFELAARLAIILWLV